jgi:hypothetical protein
VGSRGLLNEVGEVLLGNLEYPEERTEDRTGIWGGI